MSSAGEKTTMMNLIHKFFTNVLISSSQDSTATVFRSQQNAAIFTILRVPSSGVWHFVFQIFPELKLLGGKRTGRGGNNIHTKITKSYFISYFQTPYLEIWQFFWNVTTEPILENTSAGKTS